MSSIGKLQINGAPRQFPSTVWYIRVDRRILPHNRNPSAGWPRLQARRQTAIAAGRDRQRVVRADARERRSALGYRIGGILHIRCTGHRRRRGCRSSSANVTNPRAARHLSAARAGQAGDVSRHRHTRCRRGQPWLTCGVRRSRQSRRSNPRSRQRRSRTLEERVLAQMAPQQLGATVLGALGGIAVLLTLLGAYVIADSMATMRMREMGIRAALGATRRQLGAIVLAETARLVGAGVIGRPLLRVARVRTRFARFFFQVEPLDPLTLASVPTDPRAGPRGQRTRGHPQRTGGFSTVLKAEKGRLALTAARNQERGFGGRRSMVRPLRSEIRHVRLQPERAECSSSSRRPAARCSGQERNRRDRCMSASISCKIRIAHRQLAEADVRPREVDVVPSARDPAGAIPALALRRPARTSARGDCRRRPRGSDVQRFPAAAAPDRR